MAPYTTVAAPRGARALGEGTYCDSINVSSDPWPTSPSSILPNDRCSLCDGEPYSDHIRSYQSILSLQIRL